MQTRGGAKVLVVDDDPMITSRPRELPERHQYQVRVASNADQALTMIQEDQPALLLTIFR
jgi:DNA-binding response OmpR family regulator